MKRVLLYSGCLIIFLSSFFLSQYFAPEYSRDRLYKIFPPEKKEHKEPENAVKVQVASIAWPEKPKEISSPPIKTEKKAREKAFKGNVQIVGKFACDVRFYIDQMQKKGAKLVLYERGKGKLYGISEQNELTKIDRIDKTYSQTSRRITDDYPNTVKIINKAEKIYGPGHYEIILLIPDTLEKELKQTLVRIATRINKVKSDQINTFFVRYRKQNSQLAIELDKVLVGERKFDVGQTFIF